MFRKCLTAGMMTLLMASDAAWAGGDPAAGETKSATCSGCHGTAGEGVGENPKLAGLGKAEHVKMLQDYKSGAREHAMMQMFASQLSDQDMADLAAYYAGLGGE